MRIHIELLDDSGKRLRDRGYDYPPGDVSEKHRVLEEALEFLESALSVTLREPASPERVPLPDHTLRETLEGLLRAEEEFQGGWFTSLRVRRRFQQVHGSIPLSTVSTYLSRMHRDGLLERRGNRRQREYHLAPAPGPTPPTVSVEPKS